MKFRYIACLALILLTALASTELDNLYGRMPLCFILSILILSVVYAFIVYKLFSFVENDVDKTCIRGKAFHYQYVIANDSPLFFPHIRTVFFNGFEQIQRDFTVKPHESKTIETEFKFQHIGKYDVGFLSAKVFDPLDFFYIPFENSCHQVLVEPRIADIEQVLDIKNDDDPKQALFSFLKRSNTENYDGVRPYVPGDDMKRIHWKLTAHTGKYMSRLNENSQSFAVSIFIDLFQPEYEGENALCVFDSLIESSLAVANYSIERNFDVNFIYNRKGSLVTNTITNPAMLKKTAQTFASYRYDATTHMEDLLGKFQFSRQGFINFVVFTPNLTYDLAYFIARLKSIGKNPVLFYIVPKSKASAGVKRILEYLENRGIDVRIIKA